MHWETDHVPCNPVANRRAHARIMGVTLLMRQRWWIVDRGRNALGLQIGSEPVAIRYLNRILRPSAFCGLNDMGRTNAVREPECFAVAPRHALPHFDLFGKDLQLLAQNRCLNSIQPRIYAYAHILV